MPGALDGWWTLHRRFGRLNWAELLEPAIALCECGAPVPQIIGFTSQRNLELFSDPGSASRKWANAMRTYAPGTGTRRTKGEIFRNPDLARTYRRSPQGGRDAFYEGADRRAHRRLFQAHRRMAVA